MAGLRTAADVAAEYAAARASYLASLKALSITESDGTGGTSVSIARQNADEALAQMRSLSAEYDRLTGSGIKVLPAVPLD